MALIDWFFGDVPKYNLQFVDPWFLILIPVVLLAAGVMAWQQVTSRRSNVGIPTASLKAFDGAVRKASWLRFAGPLLRLLVLVLVIVALARPQGSRRQGQRSAEGVDIILVIDTSGSMQARDFVIGGERPNRLEVIKKVIAGFITERPDDRIGIVVFGTEAFTQAPLTLDHEALLKFLQQVEIGVAGEATAIGDGLATAVLRLKDQPGESRVVVLLTDGANNAGRMDPVAATAVAKALGMRVHTIGVGSKGEVPIISRGQTVYIKADIDEKLLGQIASETGGVYRRAFDTEALRGVYQEIDRLEKRRIDVKDQRGGRDFFAVPLIAALVCLMLELLWRGSRWRVIS